MEEIERLNREVFLKINAGPGSATWAIDGAVVIANHLIYLVPALLLAMWLWGDGAKRNLAIRGFLVAMIGVALNQVIGLLWEHPRPFMIGLGHVWLPHVPDSSFPSDHMTVFGGVALSLVFGGEALLGLLTFMIGLVVAWARVFLGIHFPMDMLGAFGVACLSYSALTPAWRKWGEGMTAVLKQFYRKVMAQPIRWGWVRR